MIRFTKNSEVMVIMFIKKGEQMPSFLGFVVFR